MKKKNLFTNKLYQNISNCQRIGFFFLKIYILMTKIVNFLANPL